ncbi:MAG: hypothetical protein WCV62_02660 [Candidatus Peribacteraceae bacterium]|jgi:hypothetical protein
MNKERQAFHTLEQQALTHLQLVARSLEQEAVNGGLSRGMRTHRRRVTQVLNRKTAEQHHREERDMQRRLDPPVSLQARYDKGYDKGRRDVDEYLGDRSTEIGDRWEHRGYRDGYSKVGRREIRQ